MREGVKALVREYNKTEDDLKALQVRSKAFNRIAFEGEYGDAELRIPFDII